MPSDLDARPHGIGRPHRVWLERPNDAEKTLQQLKPTVGDSRDWGPARDDASPYGMFSTRLPPFVPPARGP